MKTFLLCFPCLAAVLSAAAAPLPPERIDQMERSILPLRHGYDRHDALAAFARNTGATRNDMSAALLAIVERRTPSTNRVDAVRSFAIAELKIFGGTNALPVLRRLALDPAEPNAWEAVGAYYAIAGFTPDSLAWTEDLLLDDRPERAERRSLFLSVFRHALDGTETPAAERACLGAFVFRATEVADNAPDWTDRVLCRAFPDYAGSVERRARLEAALAWIPPSPPQRTDSMPDGLALLRSSVSNALATASATNPAPFSIPTVRAAPRVLPDEFVLPEIPQEWRQ